MRITTLDGTCELRRCINCGDLVDPVIIAHRSMAPLPIPYQDPMLPIWDPERSVLRVQGRLQRKRLLQKAASEEGEEADGE